MSPLALAVAPSGSPVRPFPYHAKGKGKKIKGFPRPPGTREYDSDRPVGWGHDTANGRSFDYCRSNRADLFAKLQKPGSLLRLRHVLGPVGSVVETDHHLRFARFARFAGCRDGRANLVFGAGFTAHFRDRCAQMLPQDAYHDVELPCRQVLVDWTLWALIVDSGTGIGLPAEHFELYVAFVGHSPVEHGGGVGDMISLNRNVTRRSDEYLDDPGHR